MNMCVCRLNALYIYMYTVLAPGDIWMQIVPAVLMCTMIVCGTVKSVHAFEYLACVCLGNMFTVLE